MKDTPRITAGVIREFFPNAGCKDKGADYCVLGAVGKWMGTDNQPFPFHNEAAPWLCQLNPALTLEDAERGSLLIIAANDEVGPAKAWKMLEEVLEA